MEIAYLVIGILIVLTLRWIVELLFNVTNNQRIQDTTNLMILKEIKKLNENKK